MARVHEVCSSKEFRTEVVVERERKRTPSKMVTDGKVTEFGVFIEPFGEINLMDLEMEYRGRNLPRVAKDFRLKEWQHFGIVHEQYYMGMVIFDAKFMGVSFFYAFDRKTGEFFEHNRTSVGGPVRVARELWHGECYFRHLGYMMEYENRLDCGLHRIRADISSTRKKPSIETDIYLLEDLDKIEPLVVVSPVDENRPLYTHKVACPVEGIVVRGSHGRAEDLLPISHLLEMGDLRRIPERSDPRPERVPEFHYRRREL